MLLVVAVAVLIVVITAILSVIESAIIYVDDLRLAAILSRKPVHGDDICYVIKNKDAHLSSMVVLITLISIAGSSSIGAIAAKQFDDIGLAVFTALLTYCMLVFAKILPKLLAVQIADTVLDHSAKFVRVVCLLLGPVLRLTLVWARLFRIRKDSELTLDELKTIIRHYNKSGIICREERNMAEQALDMNRKTLSDLLPESGSTVWLPAEATVSEVQERVLGNPFKRYVVVSGGRATGIVLYRHLTRCLVDGSHDCKVGELVRQVVYLEPETTLLEAIQ
ncbi:MAG: CNNM domain-containing protein, partial [Endozoicomonas sp.]